MVFLGIDTDSFWASMNTGVGGLTDNLGNLTSAIKEAELGLRAFDRLNVIKTPKTTGGNSGYGAGGNLAIDSRILLELTTPE